MHMYAPYSSIPAQIFHGIFHVRGRLVSPQELMRSCGSWTYGCQWLDDGNGGQKPWDLWMSSWGHDWEMNTHREGERERESEHSLIICWWDVTWWASIDYQRDILMWTAGSVRDILLGCDLYPHDLAWILQDCGFGHHISHASTATKAAKQ